MDTKQAPHFADIPAWQEIRRRLDAYDDMLAALKEGVNTFGEFGDSEIGPDETTTTAGVIARMRAAIARAES